MNLLERIDRRLADTRARIDPFEFEECATSFLTALHPGLVPITGGTDYGLDAEIGTAEDVVGVIITSSRSWDGAKKSLRNSLRSVRAHGLAVQRVHVANLVEVNRRRREALREIAQEFGVELLQIYDMAWFANKFRENPDWRRKILGIEGGPFSLSRESRGARPEERHLPTVGREDLIDSAQQAPADVVLWGVPGSGKSHVAGRLEGALFLERHPTPERLLDDLISAKPPVVVVDDAGARIEEVDLLVRLRSAEDQGYRVVAVCWPHELDAVADHLPSAVRLEVELMTREEIGALLRDRGVTRLAVIAHLLEQARGRPAWALNLADMLIRHGDWKSVWSGEAVRDQILTFLRRSNASADAVDVLATLALLGRISEDQARRLADLLQIRQPEFMRLMRTVAIAGLVDVTTAEGGGRWMREVDAEATYSVEPRIIAASLVSGVYFSGDPSPLRLNDIKAALPELTGQIVQTQIYTKLLGAASPSIPSPQEVLSILDSGDGRADASELTRTYSLLGPAYMDFVANYLLDRITEACKQVADRQAVSHSEMLASRVADALENENTGPVALFIAALNLLAAQGLDFQVATKKAVEEARDARSGDLPTSVALVRLAGALSEAPTPAADAVWTSLATEILKPTFDGNYMHPERRHHFVMQSFTWDPSDMQALFDPLESGLRARVDQLDTKYLIELIELLDAWVRVARGYPLPHGGRLSPEQETTGDRIARTIASALASGIRSPGLRAKFNAVARDIGQTLEEPDRLFAALVEQRELGADWREDQLRRDALIDAAVGPYLRQPPEVLMGWLAENRDELAMTRMGTGGAWALMVRVSTLPEDEVPEWLQSAIDHGVAGSAGVLVANCVSSGRLTIDMAQRLLDDASARSSVIAAVLSDSADGGLVETVASGLLLEDVENLAASFGLHGAPPATRHRLFTHPDPVIRSTAAAAWAAPFSYGPDAMPHDPDWLSAMSDLTIPIGNVSDYTQSEALKVLARSSPDVLIDLLVQHVEIVEARTSFNDFDEWQESIQELSSADRTRAWRRVRTTSMARELFWVIAGKDENWISEAVRDRDFPVGVRDLTRALRFQFGSSFELERLARMLRPLGWQPDDLLWTLDSGTMFGEDHERYARHVETCRRLAQSDEPDLAELGARGIDVFEPRLHAALSEARRAAVRGGGW